MLIAKLFSLTIVSAAVALALPLYAQQAADDSKNAPASQTANQPASPAADASASESAEAAATAAMIAKANAAAAAAAAKAPIAKPADSATLTKRAKQSGWMAESHGGETQYCRNVPEVGSRFSTRRCVSGVQIAEILERSEFDKDQLNQRGCGGNCGGK